MQICARYWRDDGTCECYRLRDHYGDSQLLPHANGLANYLICINDHCCGDFRPRYTFGSCVYLKSRCFSSKIKCKLMYTRPKMIRCAAEHSIWHWNLKMNALA
jgi:hypothetical protein